MKNHQAILIRTFCRSMLQSLKHPDIYRVFGTDKDSQHQVAFLGDAARNDDYLWGKELHIVARHCPLFPRAPVSIRYI
jgi:hypothetical protein